MAKKRKRPPQAKKPKLRGLTARQAAFVDEYLVDLNASAAARRAGFSQKNSDQLATQLLAKPLVAQAIDEAKRKRSELTKITAANVLREWALLAFSDVDNYEFDGDRLGVRDELDPVLLRAVSSVTIRERYDKEGNLNVERKFTLWDKPTSLRALSDHLGICSRKSETTVKGSLYSLIAGVEEDEGNE